jgi:hypothetical protein
VLLRWFVGLEMEDPVWHRSVFGSGDAEKSKRVCGSGQAAAAPLEPLL